MRGARLEAGMFTAAEGFRRRSRHSGVWSLMLRYQAQAERMYRRAIEDFDRIEARRDEIQNEPKDFIQTEKKDAVSPLKDLNPHLEISLGIYVPEAADPQSSNSEPVSGQTESGPRVISGPSNPIAA